MRSATARRPKARSSASEERQIAELRAQAIVDAVEMVLTAAQTRPAWRELQYEWFLRRLHEAQLSVAHAPPDVRLAFVDGLRSTMDALEEGASERFDTGVAAGLMRDALRRLFDTLEGRSAAPLATSEAIYAAADRIRRAGGFPYYNRETHTVDRLPKAKAIRGSVWVVHQKPGERGYALSHGPTGSLVNTPAMPKAKLEQVARDLAEQVPDLGRDAPLMHELPGGPLGTRLEGGLPRELMKPLYAARDRAFERAGVSW